MWIDVINPRMPFRISMKLKLNAYEFVEKLNGVKGNRRNVNGNRFQDLYSSYELIDCCK